MCGLGCGVLAKNFVIVAAVIVLVAVLVAVAARTGRRRVTVATATGPDDVTRDVIAALDIGHLQRAGGSSVLGLRLNNSPASLGPAVTLCGAATPFSPFLFAGDRAIRAACSRSVLGSVN